MTPISPSLRTALWLAGLILLAAIGFPVPAAAQNAVESAFQSPPDSARPQTWWHWVSGNVTSDGIAADLDAMKQIGLGGAQIFSVNQGPAGPVQYMSPQWRSLVQDAIGDADRLALQLSITDCEGWSESGGPWITPDLSMQRLAWTATTLRGNEAALISARPAGGDASYRAVAVLAFPALPGDDVALGDLAPDAVSSDGPIDDAQIYAYPDRVVSVEQPAGGSDAFLELKFPHPVCFGSLTERPAPARSEATVEVSDDGSNYKAVGTLFGGSEGARTATVSFAPVTVSRLRIVQKRNALADPLRVGQLAIGPTLVSDWQAKAGNYPDARASTSPDPQIPASMAIDPAKIVDLTSKLDGNDMLFWSAPSGVWTVLCFGMESTGTTIHPAMPQTVGLECDKLSRAAVTANWNADMARVIADSGARAGKTLKTVLMDSWEAGTGDWTALMPQDFKALRGYDPRLWLPALTGRIVASTDRTERFLWDFRRTMADLVAQNHYGLMRGLAHEHGMLLQAEAVGIGLPTVADELQCKGNTDVPMGEFWIGNPGTLSDDKEAASAAHTYGTTLAAAESFTSTPEVASWTNDPYSIKALGDRALCTGINRFCFHRYAMQPYLDRYPGMTMGPWGLNFERTNTWWKPGAAWIAYLSRCEYLLQQGLFVGDLCYFYGEGAPRSVAASDLNPAPPAGYDYDVCDADVLLHRMSVKNGRIVLPDGMSYRVLVLPQDSRITPPVARKIRDLVAAGATVVGPRPIASPSLAGYPACDDQVRAIGSAVWGDCDGAKTTRHTYGKGTVYWGAPLQDALANIGPDFTYRSHGADSEIKFIHRRAGQFDFYFVSNQKYAPVDADCTFRAGDRWPEMWRPDTGKIDAATVFTSAGGAVTMPMHFDPAESVFVVFRRPIGRAVHLTAVTTDVPSALPPAPPSVRVLQATYGLNAAVDVTEPVSAWVLAGEPALTVDNALDGGDDPAPNVIKNVTIEYDAGGREASVTIAEGQPLALPGAPIGDRDIVIRKAVYGLSGGTVDVTAQLEADAVAGKREVPVTNDLAPAGDPAPNIVKKLKVVYTVDGRKRSRTIREGEALAFYDDVQPAQPPAYEAQTLPNGGAALVVWRNGGYYAASTGRQRFVDVRSVPPPEPVSGPWRITFPAGWGAPDHVDLDRLASWTTLADAGARYFSGTAVYTTQFVVSPERLGPGKRLYLDLGQVKNLASVTVNGKSLGVLWKEPFRLDITNVAAAGSNSLSISVTNLWPNRLIGDQFLPPEKRYTWTTFNPYEKDSDLLDSGLLGPVFLRSAMIAPIDGL